MHCLKSMESILAILCFLGRQSLSQLTTAGNMYQLISGNDTDVSTSSSAKFTFYFQCGQDNRCGYVAKEKTSGKFVMKRIEDALNETRYSSIWKKAVSEINGCENNPCTRGICIQKLNGRQCICPRGYYGEDCSKKIKSCTDIFRNGTRKNGKFFILGAEDLELEVFCDFESETNSTWTLVVSYELSNRLLHHTPYYNSIPRNSSIPNWKDYRLDKANMKSVQNFTLLWRMTCSFATNGIDYRDYVRGKKQELDVIHFDGSKVCKTVEYVNVRGHSCSQCTANFYQPVGTNLHIDSDTNCDFDSTSGAVFSEDNFGVYDNANSAFRCTESLESTTQVWFGDYI